MLTKPAGVFLQLLAVPVMLVGCLDGMDAAHDGTSGVFGWSVFAIGLAMLLIGRRPAVRKDKRAVLSACCSRNRIRPGKNLRASFSAMASLSNRGVYRGAFTNSNATRIFLRPVRS